MVNGRSKGNKYENTVCKTLSRWIDPSIREDAHVEHLPFRRRTTSVVPLEGHWRGHGDILHRPDLRYPWPFCVECKAVQGWTFDGMFVDTWSVWAWWEQARNQARDAGLSPLLALRRNRTPDHALLRCEDAECLRLEQAAVGTIVRLVHPKQGDEIVIARLDDLVRTDPRRLSAVSTASKSRKRSSPVSTATTICPSSTTRKRSRSGSSS